MTGSINENNSCCPNSDALKLRFQLKSTLSPEQTRELESKQFTFLNPRQLRLMYGRRGLMAVDAYRGLGRWSGRAKRLAQRRFVADLAQGVPLAEARLSARQPRRRSKRHPATMSPFIFTPDILEVGRGRGALM